MPHDSRQGRIDKAVCFQTSTKPAAKEGKPHFFDDSCLKD